MEIIAHRGASAYLPEHTFPAKALAHAMGADYLEQDVVASKDGHLVVLHDIHVDRVTDVESVYPGRGRDDGRYYAIDFTLDELRQLTVHERCDADGQPVYPGRYPVEQNSFRLHTLDEEIRLIQGLNRSTGRDSGIYTEIKKPAWHRQQGFDLTQAVIDEMAVHGYRTPGDRAWLQCFDADENRRIREQLGCELKLVQLVAENAWQESPSDYDEMKSPKGFASVLDYADAIGPWIPQLYTLDASSTPALSEFGRLIRDAGLPCHPYTLRADELPAGFSDLETLVTFLHSEGVATGVFADQPDLAKQATNAL